MFLVVAHLLILALTASALPPQGAAIYFDFQKSLSDLAGNAGTLVVDPAIWIKGEGLDFTHAGQSAKVDQAGMVEFTKKLAGAKSMTVGGWFFSRRVGEQIFVGRGKIEIAPLGERMFRPAKLFVNFCLGTDQHGFLMGTINGNGLMPFPYVTLSEVRINRWHQLVIVKDVDGYQKFYHNGTLVRSDKESAWSGKQWPFCESAKAEEPIRLSMPHAGVIGEVWVYPRELTADEIKQDFLAKRERYQPSLPVEPVLLRRMNSHPAHGLWKKPITAANWAEERKRILEGVFKVLGPFPQEKIPLNPQVITEEDCGNYIRRKISITVQPDDQMPAYLLIPKNLKGRAPAILCFYGTTSGAGKETTVGLSGPKPGTPPEKNRAFAIDMVQAGFVAFAADYLRDGERVKPGQKPYDSTDFYQRFPNWSIVGKDVWDNMRAIDYLQTLDFVDPENIGMVGHSYGGHSTIFAAALEPRIKVAVSNGPVSHFRDYGLHWGRMIGAPGGEYIRGMRPYVLDHTLPIPVTFYEFTSLIAPRPLLVGQAVGERRPQEEENYAAVSEVYNGLGLSDRVNYVWYAGDHDFPPEARHAAVAWFRRWLQNTRRNP